MMTMVMNQKAHSMTLRLDTDGLAALLQLSSPTLPIGGFSYSQGMEAAVELKLVHDEESALTWIEQHLMLVMARSEAPLWCLLFNAWQTRDDAAVAEWNQWFYASRETAELRQETEQMGRSLHRLCQDLDWGCADARQRLSAIRPITYLSVHAFLCCQWNLSREIGVGTYIFTWAENQVAAAIKSVPIGQLAGQRILLHIRHKLPQVLTAVLERSDAVPPLLNTFAPQFSIISSRHESQFARLFRS